MTFSNRGNFGANRGQNSGRRDFNDRGSERPAMFDAVCAKCGSNCQVPFRPNGRKEVFCSKCFEQIDGGSRDSRGDSPRYERHDSSNSSFDRHMFNAVCDQCGDNCKLPFEPRNGKPVLCSNCFAGKTTERRYEPNNGSSNSMNSSSRPTKESSDLELIKAKLDQILKLLTPPEPVDITSKIIEEIESTSGKKIVPAKKKAKVASKKKA